MSIRTRTVTVEQTYYVCDVCRKEVAQHAIQPCHGCCRDLCVECRILSDHDLFTDDYIEVDVAVCQQCYTISKPFTHQASQLALQLHNLEEQWRHECQAAIQAEVKE